MPLSRLMVEQLFHTLTQILLPAIPNQPFCCDQVAIYDPAHDLMVWYLQYVRDDNSNTGRLAVAQGNDIATSTVAFYDFTPQAIGHSGEWFDYRKYVGDQFLYLTTNITTSPSFTRAVVLRLPLTSHQRIKVLIITTLNRARF